MFLNGQLDRILHTDDKGYFKITEGIKDGDYNLVLLNESEYGLFGPLIQAGFNYEYPYMLSYIPIRNEKIDYENIQNRSD
jgi:hypothetical protein